MPSRKQYLQNLLNAFEDDQYSQDDMNRWIVGQTQKVQMEEEMTTYNNMVTYNKMLDKANKLFVSKFGCKVVFPGSPIKETVQKTRQPIECHKVIFNTDGTITDIVSFI